MNEVNGQVAALEAAVLAILAASPDRAVLLDLLHKVRSETEREIDFSEAAAYADGWRRTMDLLMASPEEIAPTQR